MRQNSPRTLSQRFARAALAGATLLAIIDTVQPAAAGQPAVATQPASAAAAAGAAAIASVDLAGTWSFTPTGRGATSITVPGGGWYKQGFTDVNEAVYSRSITVPDSGQPQSTWIEFGAVNHQATLSVDGRVVATQTTAFTPSNFDITAYAAPGSTHTVSVAAHSTVTVTVGPVAWNLDSTSYWWPNVPYRSGYRAQLHRLTVHAVADDGHTGDATYRFGFREATQNGDYYYLNGVRVNFRGDNLQGADYDRINNGGKGDAYDTLPGFLPPSPGNPGWPQAVDNYQRLNFNVLRIHQEPASPYMLDVADEMGLLIIDEMAIRGSQSQQDWIAGHDNMVNHARALVLRDRNHPAVIRWSQANEPNQSGQDSEQFEKDLYAAINGNDGTRPVIVEVGVD